MRHLWIGAIFSVLGLGAAAAAGEIPVIGLEAGGRESVRAVPRDAYFQVINQAVTDTHDSILPELSCSQSSGVWKLHTIGVGIGISATVGLGPLFNVEAAPRILLLYTRFKEPVFPVQ